MEEINKRYWKGIEELTNDVEFVKNAEKEFSDNIPDAKEDGENNRRDFLKIMGFSVAAASLVACETPIKKAIPYLNKPENLDPSIPNYYASTYFEGGEYASVVVKTREGRPIKIEGNTLSPISKGKTSSRTQASILALYDDTRLCPRFCQIPTIRFSRKSQIFDLIPRYQS
jgi:molybdopterin-containing oxidoreductase family iron-sulfur binding subunit